MVLNENGARHMSKMMRRETNRDTKKEILGWDWREAQVDGRSSLPFLIKQLT